MKFRLLSEREAAKRGEFPPAPERTSFSSHLRRTLATIFYEALGRYYDGRVGLGNQPIRTTELWKTIDRIMQRESTEYVQWADQYPSDNPRARVLRVTESARDETVLDLLDVVIFVIEYDATELWKMSQHRGAWKMEIEPCAAAREIDTRLREDGMIYRVADGAVIVSTDDYTHTEVTLPALRALSAKPFANALREFHEALGAFREGKLDIVLTKANHAFESTMKIIAGQMNWKYDEKATAATMIDVMIGNGLIPPMRDGAMKAMMAMMKSDVPTLRNKMPSAGHGAGESSENIPEPFATYALNAAAANIRLLVELYDAKRKK